MPDFYCYGVKVTDHGETGKRPNYRWTATVDGKSLTARNMKEMRELIKWEQTGRHKAIGLFNSLEQHFAEEASKATASQEWASLISRRLQGITDGS